MRDMNTRYWMIIGGVAVVAVLGYGLLRFNSNNKSAMTNGSSSENAVASAASTSQSHTVTIQTSKGAIQFETFDQDAPKTVANFLKLAGAGFYDNLIFHRVVKGFVIQGGDPTGTGRGGPGYTFEDELNPDTASYKAGYLKGVVAMANAGPNTNGSQFFIMLQDYPLPHNYTIFGKVVKGQDVVDAIGQVTVDGNDKPLTPIVMQSVAVQ